MNKSLEIARRNLFYLILLLPIIVFPKSTAIFEISRTLSIGILVGLLGFYYFLFSKIEKVNLPNRYLLLFFLVSFITNLFSIDKNLSLLGSYPRFADGDLVNLITLLFIIIILNIWEKVDLIKILFYSSIPISVIGLFQSLISNERIGSTLGHPNFLGLFISLSITYQILNYQKIKLNLYLKYLILFIQTYVLIKSASLTAFIALGVVITYLLLTKKIILGKAKFIFFSFAFVAILFTQGSILFPKIKDIYFQITDRKQTTISDSLLIRFALWESTLKLITTDSKHFFLGSGSNTFVIEFEKNRNTKLDNYSEYYLFYDKPHNYFLEIFFSNGVLTLVLFIFLIYKTLKTKSVNSVYVVIILLFISFNWMDIYSRLILFSLVSLNLKKEEFKSSKLKYTSMMYIFIFLISGIFLYAETKFYERDYQSATKLMPFNDVYKSQYLISKNENLTDFYFENHNPEIKIDGLKLYQGKKLEEFKLHLLQSYPSNLPIKLMTENSK